VTVDVDLAMTHDALGAHTIAKFKELTGEEGKVWSKDKIVIILDHYVPSNTIDTAKKVQHIERFVEEQRITNYHGIGKGGICHKVLLERGYVTPGDLVAGTDSHTTTHGVVGAFAIGVGVDDMACIWKTGRTWERVPETLLVEVNGKMEGLFKRSDVEGPQHTGCRWCDTKVLQFMAILFILSTDFDLFYEHSC
jgi:3-isopropylmalate/(R)-2-methylmalate dehydratase large subunit